MDRPNIYSSGRGRAIGLYKSPMLGVNTLCAAGVGVGGGGGVVVYWMS